MARLFVLSGNSLGATFDFMETSIVGRGDGADIVIAEASISRKHARLVPRPDPGLWKVVDLDSSNGVFVGGKRVKSGIVGDGDTFRLGEVELRLRDDLGGEAAPEMVEDDEPIADVAEAEDELAFEDSDDDEFELEFGEDLDDAIQSRIKEPAAGVAPAPMPADRDKAAPSAGARAGARATEQRNQRRQQALKGAGAGAPAKPQGDLVGGGRQVLQYASSQHRSSGTDLSQMSSAQRALLILLGFALMGGIAYGAFTLTRTARSQSAVLAE
jgi:pSer/pThr/pTyr-binding forkhead associated (FHA) protein